MTLTDTKTVKANHKAEPDVQPATETDGKPLFNRELSWLEFNRRVLEFAVAMQAQYANQGYAYPGSYNVKLKVEPK